jgi:hypothetical protein
MTELICMEMPISSVYNKQIILLLLIAVINHYEVVSGKL